MCRTTPNKREDEKGEPLPIQIECHEFLFVSNADGNADIYLQRVDGRNAINLTKDSRAADQQPVFSPDGSQIAFRSSRDGGGILWHLRASSCEPLPMPDARHVITDARWSADGRRLVALESPSGNVNSTSGIVIYDFDKKAYRRLGDDPAYALTWLSNQAIAFATARGLTVLDLATSKRREIKLARPAGGPRSIAASPDGKFVYVRTARTDGDVFLATLSPR